MKPTRLFCTVLFAAALVSCSSDSIAPDPQEIDTYLSFTANAGDVITKASETGLMNERFVDRLTALVFAADDEGKLLALKDTSAAGQESIDKITNIKVKVAAMGPGEVSTTPVKIILLANVPEADVRSITKFADLNTKSFGNLLALKGLGGQPMSSEVLKVTGLVAGKDNWIKQDGKVVSSKPSVDDYVVLTRYAARIQIESLRAYFTENNKGAKFTLTKVSLANVSSKSLYTKGATSFYPGSSADTYFYRGFPKTVTEKDHYIVSGTYDEALFAKTYSMGNVITANKGDQLDNAGGTYNSNVLSFGGGGGLAQPQFYAFDYQGEVVFGSIPKNNIQTMMIITGNYETPQGVSMGERSFRIPIKVSENANAPYGVARNTIYKVSATLTGEGTGNPDENMLNAMVNFQIKVEAWKSIAQKEEDVN